MNVVVVFDLDGVDRAGKLDEYFQRRAPLDTLVLSAFVDRTCRYGVQMWYCGPDDPEHIAALHTALARARATNAWMGEDRRGHQRPANGAGREGWPSAGHAVQYMAWHTASNGQPCPIAA